MPDRRHSEREVRDELLVIELSSPGSDRAIQYAEAYRFKSLTSLEYWVTRFRG